MWVSHLKHCPGRQESGSSAGVSRILWCNCWSLLQLGPALTQSRWSKHKADAIHSYSSTRVIILRQRISSISISTSYLWRFQDDGQWWLVVFLLFGELFPFFLYREMNCIVQTSEAWATPDVVEFAHRMCAGPTGTIEPRRSFQLAQLCRIWRRSTSKWGYLDTLEVLGVLLRGLGGCHQELIKTAVIFSSNVDVDGTLDIQLRVECVKQESPGTLEPTTRSEGAPKSGSGACAYAEGFCWARFWNTIVFLFKLLTSSFFPKFGHQVKDSKPWSRSCFRFGDMFFLNFQWKPKIQIQRCWNFYRAWVWVVGIFGTCLISHLFQDLRCDAGHVAHPRNGTACGGRWRLHLQHLAGAKKNPSGCTWKSLKKDHNMLPLCDAAKASDWCSKLLGLCCLKDSIVMWSVKAWETEN